ncbi:MAG TPA: helix-turn-helix transcriptional regulator [Propionibacteriaceae bacterium]|nr:helix-turn-helix transcriptional regulator [Propionibacteriaceae bacterium]
MSSRGGLLREVMLETSTTQSELSRVSGVHQPSISQFLSGKVELSDEQLDRLLSCMGYRLEVVRRPVVPELTRSERRSWRLHRQLSTHLTRTSLEQWRPTIERNLERIRNGVSGEPHGRNLDRWMSLIDRGDVPGLHRVLTGLERDSIEMRVRFPRWAGCSRSTSVWTCCRWPVDASRRAAVAWLPGGAIRAVGGYGWCRLGSDLRGR